jgi:hypothetical protein
MTTSRLLAVMLLLGVLASGCSVSDDTTNEPSSKPAKSNESKESTPPDAEDATPDPASGPMTGPTGEVVRSQLLLLSSTDFDAPPPERIGFEFGAKAGACTNIDPAPERAGLIAAVMASDPEATEVDLSNPEVLVADCGNVHAAIAKWGSAETSLSINEFERRGTGEWSSIESDQYAPCGLPADVLKLWQLDGITC